MDNGDIELMRYVKTAPRSSEERARLIARKRNAAFKKKLQQRNEAKREAAKLKIAVATATLSWVFAGIQFLR